MNQDTSGKPESNPYKNYFQSHYGYTFSKEDIVRYRRWFGTQWRFISSRISIRKKGSILEVGSGLGGFYSFLSSVNKINYRGIELDPHAVKFANEHFHTTNFTVTSLEDMQKQEHFDYVFAFEVLEHLTSPIDSIKKIRLHLRNHGIFVGTTPYPYLKNVAADKTHLYVLHPKSWEKLFFRAGFKSVQLYPFSFFPFIWRISTHVNVRIPFYIPFRGFISTTLIVACK